MQQGGTLAVVQSRDAIAGQLGTPEFSELFGLVTAFPATELESYALPPFFDDSMGRVYVWREDHTAGESDRWRTTTDQITGLKVQLRRADCGLGCRCAVEVRLVGRFGS